MHLETHPIGSKGVKLWLMRRFYEQHGKPPGAQALQDALGVLEAKALFDGEERPVYVRVAEQDGAIYIDLANDSWEAVEITQEGWRIVSDPPVRFRRPKGMKPLPYPVEGGKVDGLRKFVNVKDEKSWRLLVAWLIQAFRPTGPYLVLILQGEQGSAKTTLARILRAIGDPSTTPVRTIPRSEHDLMIAANNSWLLAFDNLSGLAPWLSDALCRLSTGGGFGTRTLYENDEETLFDAMRPAILNGIADIATRADLLDRSVIVELPRIEDAERKDEKKLWEEFEEDLPAILGGIFDAVSAALRELPNTELASLPRMADVALWVTAAEGALGWESGAFMKAYAGSREEVNELALESDPVAVAVVKFMEDKDEWVGTASKLLGKLSELTDDNVERTKAWPKAPHHLGSRLKRLAPVLRGEGIRYENLDRVSGERRKRLSKIKPAKERHQRHERHGGEEARKKGDSAHDADDAGVTLSVNEDRNERHTENPIKPPKTPNHDADDANDAGIQPFSKGHLIATHSELQDLGGKIEEADLVGLDLETTGLDPKQDRIRLVSLATAEGVWLIDCFAVDPSLLFPVLAEKQLVVVHNAMHDLLFLRRLGYKHRGRVADTMILSRMVYAGERDGAGKRLGHSLGACCGRELDLELDKTHQKADWSGELSEEMLAYAATDTRALLALHETLERKLWDAGQELAMEIEERALLAGIEMAFNGVRVDKARWLRIVEEAGEGLEELRESLDDLVGEPPEEIRKRNIKNKNIPAERKDKWNWDSADQIKAAAVSIGLELEKTSMEYLKLVDHNLAKALLAYREVKSGLSTYGEKFFEPTEDGREVYLDGRVYPSWGMCQADTGRMSCSSPNMQNIPKKGRLGGLRECVVAPEGRRLIQAYYSQIELRIVSKVAGEEAMLEAFRESIDIHTRTTRSVVGAEGATAEARKLAKGLNFGLLYGMGAGRLRDKLEAEDAPKLTLEEAAHYREQWFETYPAIRDWHRREGADLAEGGDSASTLTGRLRRVASFMEKVNHPVQGTGADGLKLAMALFHERLPDHLDAKLVIACHDELLVECPEDQAEEVAQFVEDVMVTGMDEVVNQGLDTNHPDRVPIEVDVKILKSWGDDQ